MQRLLMHHCFLFTALAAILLPAGFALAQPELPSAKSASDDEVGRLAERIDQLIAERWQAEGVVVSPLVDDASFMRRVSLDIAGKIPAVADLHDFLEDPSPAKRRDLVDRLLESPAYITHFAHIWRDVMMPEAESNLEIRFLVPAFEAWVRRRISENVAFDAMVRELLTVTVDPRTAANPFQLQGEVSAASFYQAKQLKPEDLAAATSRMFLGVRIECAQCHDHPFDVWRQEQFWGYAAFFAGLEREQPGGAGLLGSIKEMLGPNKLVIPKLNKTVEPTYFDGTQPTFKFRESPRQTLANWMTSAENPYFAKAAANRLWGHFFGLGLVQPIDDFTADNPPSHPELLEELARGFAEARFDLKFMIRAITASQTYQRSSQQTDSSQENPRLFARMALKGLSPEQIFDSIAQATGFYEPFASRNPFAMGGDTPRDEFVQMFNNSRDTVTETQTTILQALAMMNGRFVADATSLERSATLAAVADFPLMSTAERIEALYLAALGRKPREAELERLSRYVDEGGAARDRKKALGDLFWALLNSSEFLFNR